MAIDESMDQAPKIVELYDFYDALSDKHYRYTSDISDVTYTNLYTACRIKRSSILQRIDMEPDTINITLPATLAFVSSIITCPINPLTVTISRGSGANFIVICTAAIIDFSFNRNECTLKCKSGLYELQKKIPNIFYQSLCNNRLGDSVCGITLNNYKIIGEVTSISGENNTVIAMTTNTNDSFGQSFADVYALIVGLAYPYGLKYFKSGYLQITIGGSVQKREILDWSFAGVTATFYIQYPLIGLTVSNLVDVYPGCLRDAASCVYKFDDNRDHFSGMPVIPQASELGMRV